MKNFLEILWGILINKWIKYKFELENNVAKMAKQEISIYLQNMVRCLKFLMRYSGLQNNQLYEPFYVYNENEEQVYNEMHTGNWQQNQQKSTLLKLLIYPS